MLKRIISRILTPILNNTNYSNEIFTENKISHLPLKQLIEKAFPSKNELYPHELLTLYYAPKYKVGEFSKFKNDYCKAKESQKILQKLIHEKFLIEGDMRSTLNHEKVVNLKSCLKLNHLPVSGKKIDLIERLFQNVPESELKKSFPEQYYGLTIKGETELADNNYIEFTQTMPFCVMDIWQANIFLHNKVGFSAYDASWYYLNEECHIHITNGDYGLYRNTRYNMALQLLEESKMEQALFFLTEVCYLDLSGLSNNYNSKYFADTIPDSMEHFFPYESSILFIPEIVIIQIKDILDILGWSNNNFTEFYTTNANKLTVPFHVFTKEEVCNIVIYKLHNDNTSIGKIYIAARNRLQQQYKFQP